MGTKLDTVPVDDFLAHYGVPGMKWGKRKVKEASDRRNDPQLKLAKATTKAHNKDDLKAAKYRKTLSDHQLQTRIDRLQKEKKLKDLVEDDLRPGKKIAKSITSQAGQRVISGILVGALAYGAKVGIDKVVGGEATIDRKEAASYLSPANPNKKKK